MHTFGRVPPGFKQKDSDMTRDDRIIVSTIMNADSFVRYCGESHPEMADAIHEVLAALLMAAGSPDFRSVVIKAVDQHEAARRGPGSEMMQ